MTKSNEAGRCIAVVAGKGGAGKSTLSISLAAALHQRGKKVILLDADPQGTALKWSGRRADDVEGPTVAAVGDDVPRTVQSMQEAFDLVIVDTASRLSGRTVRAMASADLVLVPMQPSPVDLDVLEETTEILESTRDAIGELDARGVITAARRTALSRAVQEAFPMPVLEQGLGDRVAFGEAYALGMGVTQYEPRGKASGEVKALAEEVEAILWP